MSKSRSCAKGHVPFPAEPHEAPRESGPKTDKASWGQLGWLKRIRVSLFAFTLTVVLALPLGVALFLALSNLALPSPARDLVLFALGGIESLGVAIGSQILLNFYQRPVLKINGLILDEKGSVATREVILPNGKYASARVASLSVTNSGKDAAEDSRAQVIATSERGAANTSHLCWGGFNNPQVLTIYGQETVPLDVYAIPGETRVKELGKDELLIPSNGGWNGYLILSHNGSEKIRLRVQIFAKNAKPSNVFVAEV